MLYKVTHYAEHMPNLVWIISRFLANFLKVEWAKEDTMTPHHKYSVCRSTLLTTPADITICQWSSWSLPMTVDSAQR